MFRNSQSVTVIALLATIALPACRSSQVERLPAVSATEPTVAIAEKLAIQPVSYEEKQLLQPPEPRLSQPIHSTPVDSPPRQPPAEDISRDRITINDLESIALQRNPTLARAEARINAARGEWLQVGLRPNPRIGYDGGEIGNEGGAGFQGAFLSQEIVTADKLRLSRSVMDREIERLQQEFAVQQQRVLTDVRRSFYDVLAPNAARRRTTATTLA